jgi:purine nucleosidase
MGADIMPKIHLDTDLGGDIDDICALALVLNWPGADLVAVTTNTENDGRRAGYTRYALRLAGRADVPVAAGAEVALGYYRGMPGLPDEAAYWPEPVTPAPGPLDEALALLERSIEQGALIVGIGAYTNLALLERRSPGILRRAHLYLMGGYVYPVRPGYPLWGNDVDWNIQADVNSAKTVIENSQPTLIPLSMTVETALRRGHLPALRQAGPLAQLIARQAEAFAVEYDNETVYGRTCPALPADIINWQHDPLACAIALGWREGVEIREVPLRLDVEDGWLHERVDPAGQPVRVVTRADGARFSELWVSLLIAAI